MAFRTCTSAIEHELTTHLREQKRENERKRYHDRDGLARSEKFIKLLNHASRET
jgi:hypothetical protein